MPEPTPPPSSTPAPGSASTPGKSPGSLPALQSVQIYEERGIVVMRFPAGRMDGNTIREMYELTVRQIDRPNARLLVDLTGVSLVPSAGLGMFVTLKKKCLGVGAQMLLLVPDPQVMRTFGVMRLDLVLQLYPDRDTALRRFKPPVI